MLPRTHGSALFQRGETQALVTTTLGTVSDEQRVDGLADEYSKKFMLDYNFPPFCVGECKPIRGPGRREIGHGALAERSLKAGHPRRRTSSPTRSASSPTSSNRTARRSMAVGLRRHAGADGRRRADQRPGRRHLDRPGQGAATSFIAADRHHGRRGPLRRHGLQGRRHRPRHHRHPARPQDRRHQRGDHPRPRSSRPARPAARSCERMLVDAAAAARRDQPAAPRGCSTIKINPEKIGLLIGPGGKNIKGIQEATGAKIDIEDDGTVYIAHMRRGRRRGGQAPRSRR